MARKHNKHGRIKDNDTPEGGVLGEPAVRKFADWIANKDPDLTATLSRKKH